MPARIEKPANEQAIRDAILVGRAERMEDGYYRIEMPDATYIYGAEYVKRILEWRDHS